MCFNSIKSFPVSYQYPISISQRRDKMEAADNNLTSFKNAENARGVGTWRTGTAQWKMTQNQLKTLHAVCLTQHYTNLCSQPISVMFKNRWQAFARTLRDKPPPPFSYLHTWSPLYSLYLLAHSLPQGSLWWFHAYYNFYNAGWIMCEYVAAALWITAPSSRRCGVAKKLISPAPQKAACVLNV